MKLLIVKAVLDREADIQHTGSDAEREVLQELDDKTTSYAIVSHRWGVDSEVTYKEMTGLMKMEERRRNEIRKRTGYQKIIESCKQAKQDGYEWLWIDTCCIDKRSSSELSEAINSMYRWYQNAQVCYAYLNDVDETVFPTKQDNSKFDQSNGWPEWFMRGWTLQELIAPKQIEFFNKDWVFIGNKWRLAPMLENITGIPCEILRDGLGVMRLSVAQIMSWAANRKTTRMEDRAYSLMGLFGVNMPMLYGEGKKAFQRLQLEIIRTSTDHSIFAWSPQMPRTGSVLADDPSDFGSCRAIEKVDPDKFGDKLVEHIEWKKFGVPGWLTATQRSSWKILTNLIHWFKLAWLRWRVRALSQQLRTFTVSNAGIQVCLPVVPLPDSPYHFRAILACTNGCGPMLVTIDLLFSGSGYDRIPDVETTPRSLYPELRTLYLDHHQDVNEKRREFTLDDKNVLYHGFARHRSYPREFTGNSVTLSSLADDLIVVVYANDNARSCFAVGLGYYLGQGWVHVVNDQRFPVQEADWAEFVVNTHNRMWNARADDHYFIKHAHLPQSIWAAKVVWGRRETDGRLHFVIASTLVCRGLRTRSTRTC
ncbi:heterokaryon incompatibility protein-domain-containing protein [Pisolithus thermaeus]|nr:heterokaryon incompatibility protein-domain-containing protein [Pisolithus thermaeus]